MGNLSSHHGKCTQGQRAASRNLADARPSCVPNYTPDAEHEIDKNDSRSAICNLSGASLPLPTYIHDQTHLFRPWSNNRRFTTMQLASHSIWLFQRTINRNGSCQSDRASSQTRKLLSSPWPVAAWRNPEWFTRSPCPVQVACSSSARDPPSSKQGYLPLPPSVAPPSLYQLRSRTPLK
jgi:hypothetical protein